MYTAAETTTFSDVAAMLDCCRTEFEKSGFQSQADALKGLEVFDVSGAEVALLTLRSLPRVTGPAEDMKRYTVAAIIGALQSNRLAS